MHDVPDPLFGVLTVYVSWHEDEHVDDHAPTQLTLGTQLPPVHERTSPWLTEQEVPAPLCGVVTEYVSWHEEEHVDDHAPMQLTEGGVHVPPLFHTAQSGQPPASTVLPTSQLSYFACNPPQPPNVSNELTQVTVAARQYLFIRMTTAPK